MGAARAPRQMSSPRKPQDIAIAPVDTAVSDDRIDQTLIGEELGQPIDES